MLNDLIFMFLMSRYNQIKNYDFQKNEFKGAASDFTQLVWKETGIIGFGSKKAADGALYVLAYYGPAGNNETLGFADNVNRVTGAGDLDQSQREMIVSHCISQPIRVLFIAFLNQ